MMSDCMDVFDILEKDRKSGELRRKIYSGAQYRYRSSKTRPEFIERVSRDGEIHFGNYQNGKFVIHSE